MTTTDTISSAPDATTQAKKSNFYRAQTWFPFFLIVPSLIIIALVILYPMGYSIYVSFTPFHLLRPEKTFVFSTDTMFRNYVKLFNDKVFWRSLGNTILFLAVTVNLSFLLALALSQLMARVTRGQGLLRTLLMVPMMFAPVLVGFQFAWFFNATVGLVNNALISLGLLHEPRAWLVDQPSDVDGANAWQKFQHITFPLLRPFTLIALTVLSLDIGRAYDVVRIMTGGGPAHRTEMIWTYAGRLAIRNSQFGLASAMSMVGVVLGVLFTLYLFQQLRKSRVVY